MPLKDFKLKTEEGSINGVQNLEKDVPILAPSKHQPSNHQIWHQEQAVMVIGQCITTRNGALQTVTYRIKKLF